MFSSQNTALFYALNETEAKERLALFEEQDVVDAVHNGKIEGTLLNFLSDEHVKACRDLNDKIWYYANFENDQ